jgi:F-type H+-transporting ATPase subunit epsilon
MAEGKIRLELVTPYGSVFSGDVDEVTATGSEGEFGVLPGHAPFMTTLSIGSLYTRDGARTDRFFVNWGYSEVSNDRMIVLADSAEAAREIDVERAMAAKRRAEELLKKQEQIDMTRAEASLTRAISRIQLAEEHSKGRS